MADNKFEVVEPDSPLRCQAIHGAGQCKYKVVEGAKVCPMHGGNTSLRKAQQQMLHQYRLAVWQADIADRFAGDDQVKNLRGEIGILRMTLESVLAACKEPTDLLLYQAKISDLVTRIEKIVSSCHRIESSTGQLLDKQKVLTLATVIVEIISRHVTDDEAISNISQSIVQAVLESQGIAKLET